MQDQCGTHRALKHDYGPAFVSPVAGSGGSRLSGSLTLQIQVATSKRRSSSSITETPRGESHKL